MCGATVDFKNISSVSYIPFDISLNYLVVSNNHPALKKGIENLSIADFKNDIFLLFNGHALMTSLFISVCNSFGFEPKHIPIYDETTLLTMVQLGAGITIMTDTHLFSERDGITCVPLPELGITELGFIYNHPIHNRCKMFIEYLQKYLSCIRE